MAIAGKIEIAIEPVINSGVANLCLKALELFMNHNPELDIVVQRLPDYSVMLKFEERKYCEPPKEEDDNGNP